MADHNHSPASLGFVFTVGLLAGYVASLVIPEKTQEKVKEQLSDSAKKIKDSVSEVASTAPDVMSLYMEGRSQIMDELAAAQESWDNIDKRKYTTIMKRVLEKLAQEREIPTKLLDQLREYLESDYQTFRSTKKGV
jgi:hypothetical protein